jgi:hypothetical protein
LRRRNIEPLFDRNPTAKHATIGGGTNDEFLVPRRLNSDQPHRD